MVIFRLQRFRKLSRHLIYGNIKTRYNVFRKYANDVFGAGNNPRGLSMTARVAVAIEEASK